MDYSRRENETDYEYCFRLSWMKKREGLDIDWQEIIDMCGLDWSSDHCRKTMLGAVRHQEYLDSKTKEQLSDEQYEKLLQKEFEIKKEKVKLQDMRTYVNKKTRELARCENMYEILEDKLSELPQQMINENFVSRETSGKDGLLLISDVHYGLDTRNALTKYNSDICKEKMNYLIDKTIEYSKFNNIDKLNVFCLGDEISGIIHTTTRLENRETVIEQVLEVSELLSEALIKLAHELPYVVFGMAQGNHSRVTADKKEHLESENFTKIVKEFIKIRTVHLPNLLFLENDFDESIIKCKIKGKTIVGVHGENDRLSHLSRLIEMFDEKIDYVCMGHYHNAKEFENNNTEIIINGCFSGDDYSKKMRLYNKPIQKLLLFTNEGKIASYNINLDYYNK